MDPTDHPVGGVVAAGVVRRFCLPRVDGRGISFGLSIRIELLLRQVELPSLLVGFAVEFSGPGYLRNVVKKFLAHADLPFYAWVFVR